MAPLSLLLLPLLFTMTSAATFDIVNRCPYTVWATVVPGGAHPLDSGENLTINVNPGTTGGRVWPRLGCSFDGSGRGQCQTGLCGGVLECEAYGQPPNTLAEYALNQFNNLDYFDISLVDGFNVPMDFSPTSGGRRGIRCTADINGQCPAVLRDSDGHGEEILGGGLNVPMDFSPTSGGCRGIRCTADRFNGQCPAVLRAPGGCNNPCTVFKTNECCCTSGSCQPTDYSRFFKDRCPDAYSYPKDDQTSTFTCPGGTNNRVVFCP